MSMCLLILCAVPQNDGCRYENRRIVESRPTIEMCIGIHIYACFIIVSAFCHSHTFCTFFFIFHEKQLFANEMVKSEFGEEGN
jgi:hypothetical protein